MKMIMAKGVFKMRAVEAWMCVCVCVRVCVRLCLKVVHANPPPPAAPAALPCPADATTLHQWK